MHDRYYVCQWPKSLPLPQPGTHPMDERNVRVIQVDHVSRRVRLYFERSEETTKQVGQQRSATCELSFARVNVIPAAHQRA